MAFGGHNQRKLELFDLADRKGFDVVRAVLADHVRLIGPDGETVKWETGSAAFSIKGAMAFLNEQPDFQTKEVAHAGEGGFRRP